MKVLINQIIEKLEITTNQKNKPTNKTIIELLENCDLETINVNPTKKGFNFGDIVETLVKYQVMEYLGINYDFNNLGVSSANNIDLDLSNCNELDLLNDLKLKSQAYEIKLISSLSFATFQPTTQKNKTFIIVDIREKNRGVYLVNNVNDLLFYKKDKTIKVKGFSKGVYLDLISELLGL